MQYLNEWCFDIVIPDDVKHNQVDGAAKDDGSRAVNTHSLNQTSNMDCLYTTIRS